MLARILGGARGFDATVTELPLVSARRFALFHRKTRQTAAKPAATAMDTVGILQDCIGAMSDIAAPPTPIPSSLLPPDGRQSEAAAAIARGASRCLLAHGYTRLPEFALPNGRRADLCALAESGEMWIVEIKSSIADFRADQKWPEYRDYCDRLYFAVDREFPVDVLPQDCGLIIADKWSGEIIRPAPEHKLAPARRKTLMLRFARVAALRLQGLGDPELGALG